MTRSGRNCSKIVPMNFLPNEPDPPVTRIDLPSKIDLSILMKLLGCAAHCAVMLRRGTSYGYADLAVRPVDGTTACLSPQRATALLPHWLFKLLCTHCAKSWDDRS